MHYVLVATFCTTLLLQLSCPTSAPQSVETSGHSPAVRGLTLVAPPSPFAEDPMPAIQAVHANWVALVPYGFSRKGQTTVSFNTERQWWGEREAGIKKSVALAKNAGIKVMLKPQVWSHNWWTGDYDFSTEAEWAKWEQAYRTYILFYAELAEALEVDLFAVGTEFKVSVRKRPSFWSDLISDVRKVCDAPLTFATNWDNYANIPFWKDLDYVGINAYFPLCPEKTPTVSALKKLWQPILKEVDDFHQTVQKPILFTEYGYLSVDACAHKTWELEARVKSTPINEQAQANALEALYRVWSTRPYWEGGFLWKWFPGGQGHEGYPERDYTPQGKQAEKTITSFFKSWADSAPQSPE